MRLMESILNETNKSLVDIASDYTKNNGVSNSCEAIANLIHEASGSDVVEGSLYYNINNDYREVQHHYVNKFDLHYEDYSGPLEYGNSSENPTVFDNMVHVENNVFYSNKDLGLNVESLDKLFDMLSKDKELRLFLPNNEKINESNLEYSGVYVQNNAGELIYTLEYAGTGVDGIRSTIVEWNLILYAIKSPEDGRWLSPDYAPDDVKWESLRQMVYYDSLIETVKDFGFKIVEGKLPEVHEK